MYHVEDVAPSRERELKLYLCKSTNSLQSVAPSRERELKPLVVLIRQIADGRRSLTGA